MLAGWPVDPSFIFSHRRLQLYGLFLLRWLGGCVAPLSPYETGTGCRVFTPWRTFSRGAILPSMQIPDNFSNGAVAARDAVRGSETEESLFRLIQAGSMNGDRLGTKSRKGRLKRCRRSLPLRGVR